LYEPVVRSVKQEIAPLAGEAFLIANAYAGMIEPTTALVEGAI
jgi:hypothetical protein